MADDDNNDIETHPEQSITPKNPLNIQKENPESEPFFKINKIHIRPGNPIGNAAENGDNYLATLPTIEEKASEYIPMPYTFRLPPSPKSTHTKNLTGKCPPFYLLLDHTIAIIWMLFSNQQYNKSPLGIVQLQWALTFLKTIYLRTGERPQDVNLCIDRIEDILIEQYAHLAQQDYTAKTPVIRNFPFSKNYADLVAQLGEKKATKVSSITSAQAEEELESLKKAAGVNSIENLDSNSKEKAKNVLKMLYAQQCGKVKENMEKLQLIEDRIKGFADTQLSCLDSD